MVTLEAMKEQLEAERETVQTQLADLEARLAVKPDYGLGAGDPAVYQWEFNLVLRERTLKTLAELEEALERIAQGTYGICSQCGAEIEAERLEVLPSTTLCARCAQARR